MLKFSEKFLQHLRMFCSMGI